MRAVITAASAVRHSMGALAEALLIAAIIAALLLALSPVYRPADFLAGTEPAAAAKGGPNSGHISVPDGVFAGTTTATVNPGGETMWVFAECQQAGVPVYRQYVKVAADGTAVLTLGPTPSWTSGGASCFAEEGYWFKGTRWRAIAETTFQVSG